MANKTTASPSDSQSNGDTIRYLAGPCDASTLFCFDLLAVFLVSAAVFGSLQFLVVSSSDFTFHALSASAQNNITITPLEFFVGNALILIVCASVLSVTLTMVFCHVRYLVAERGDFRVFGIVGFLLVLAMGAMISMTVFRFYVSPADFIEAFAGYLAVQLILVAVTLFFSAMLKSELLFKLYVQTCHSGLERIDGMRLNGQSSRADRNWLKDCIRNRRNELVALERQYGDHINELRSEE